MKALGGRDEGADLGVKTLVKEKEVCAFLGFWGFSERKTC